jgi:hypothetical protein
VQTTAAGLLTLRYGIDIVMRASGVFCSGATMTDSDDRKATSDAMRWASQVTSLGMELAVPAGAGVWLDSKYDTLPGFTLVGVCFGSYLAFRGLQQLLRDLDK